MSKVGREQVTLEQGPVRISKVGVLSAAKEIGCRRCWKTRKQGSRGE